MILVGTDHFLTVPVEATAFFGAIAGFVVLLLVLALYLSRKWYYVVPSAQAGSPSAASFGGVCVASFAEANGNLSTSHHNKRLDPETSSDSEEDALRRLKARNHHPDTLTIQAEDGVVTVLDPGTSSCTEDHSPDQQQCVVEVGASNAHLDSPEDGDIEVEANGTASNCDVVSDICSIPEDVGTLEVAFLYDAPMREMTVHVLQGRNYPTGVGGSQVRLVLLPSKKQRRKTRVRQGTSPQYMESFLLHRVSPEDVNAMGVRIRVYQWSGRIRRERLLGEARVSFELINLQLETNLWLPLQPPPTQVSMMQDWTGNGLTRSDSTGSQQSVQSYALPMIPPYGSSMKGGDVAEILLGLAYNGTTGRLSVEIIKGSHFRSGNDTKPPDTYVKLTLVDFNGHEMGRAKTGLRRAQPNPLYKDTFIFQVALFQLGDVTLFISVYNRRRGSMGRKGREMIGWLCLGQNSSGADELQHWNDMRSVRQPTQVQRWHALLRP